MVDGVQGPVTDIAADPVYLDVTVPPRGTFSHPVGRGHACFAYLFEGQGRFALAEGEGRTVAHPQLIVFEDGDYVEIRATEAGVRFLLVSGKPLGEPIARYGPFVMNTREEINQALRDLRNGTFVQPKAED
jgi:hypothetical protein